jgi:hypothetical protein
MKRPRAVKLRDLPEMPKVVRSPLAKHLMERDVAKLRVSRFSLTRVRRDAP